ncbi:hypothetical protein ABIB94_007065 [Bradyrhizobium sp. JR7.2]|uniref:GIY-YIG nuclease family protein n=1 Tax=Bradyrhizobium sp. JR7.2 TaxID=3156375 RepID=UPI003397865E
MTSFVYFIQVGVDGPIKIGISDDPTERMGSLQCGCPWRLRIIGAAPGAFENEEDLHKRFADIRMEGEWFHPSKALLAEIAHILAPEFAWPSVERNALDRAILLAGSQCDLSNAIGISQPAISVARRTGKVGPRLAAAIHRFSNGQIHASEMRPDLWARQ